MGHCPSCHGGFPNRVRRGGWWRVRRASLAIALGVVTWSLAAPPAAAGGDEPTKSVPDDLTELSLEELMSVEVTSVARKEQKLAETPSAVYVITQEDIRRSTARSVPDLLRSVPGLEVAQVNANQWAISARGFNLPFANKLLVLIDGRSVYTPLFSGVYWDVQDVLLEDVERIEVIRGPGATVWGANAVNGVINIITKSAKDTQGVLLNAGGGTEEKRFGGVRYGGQLGEDTYFRVYGKYFARDHF
ncbi:MAG: TonB-dependent receptor plug domain-containing protein, partial [Planctomycetota bacterium]